LTHDGPLLRTCSARPPLALPGVFPFVWLALVAAGVCVFVS